MASCLSRRRRLSVARLLPLASCSLLHQPGLPKRGFFIDPPRGSFGPELAYYQTIEVIKNGNQLQWTPIDHVIIRDPAFVEACANGTASRSRW